LARMAGHPPVRLKLTTAGGSLAVQQRSTRTRRATPTASAPNPIPKSPNPAGPRTGRPWRPARRPAPALPAPLTPKSQIRQSRAEGCHGPGGMGQPRDRERWAGWWLSGRRGRR
jgi:hypothetical protein